MPDLRWSNFFPHKAVFTEKHVPDQAGKVFIVTGGTGGLGKELCSILYEHNAKVYVTARSESKSVEMMDELRRAHPKSTGELVFLKLELDDLTTIKASAQEFLAKESRLDVLWNNAGVMVPPNGSKTKQGYELQLGVNNLGHFHFTHFLIPVLKETAKKAPPNSVRVVWVSSSAADHAPHPAIDFSNMDYAREEGIWSKYCRSKAGNVLHSAEFARRTKDSGIISLVSSNSVLSCPVLSWGIPPTSTDIRRALPPLRHSIRETSSPISNKICLECSWPCLYVYFFSLLRRFQFRTSDFLLTALFCFSNKKLIAHEPKKGAYTELFAGLSKEINNANNGSGWGEF